MTPVTGSYYQAGKSERLVAQLQVTETGRVTITSEEKRLDLKVPSCTFNELNISARLGNTPRHITFPDSSSFETEQNDQIDTLLQSFNQGLLYRWIHFLESHLAVVLVLVAFVSVFIWGSVRFGIPVVAKYSADAMPAEVVQYLGQGTLDLLDKTVFEPSELSTQRQQELSNLFTSYAAQYPGMEYNFDFRKGGKIGANAMALPDGSIIFTDELVALAEDDFELLAIMGHEVGHLQQRHLLRRFIQDSMVTVLIVMITGDVSSASAVIFTIPALLLELSYSREFETEADDFAYQFLVDNKIEIRHFANIMLRLVNDDTEKNSEHNSPSKNQSYFSSHPDTEKRIEKFITDQAY